VISCRPSFADIVTSSVVNLIELTDKAARMSVYCGDVMGRPKGAGMAKTRLFGLR